MLLFNAVLWGKNFIHRRALKKNNPWSVIEDAGKKQRNNLYLMSQACIVLWMFTEHLLSILTKDLGGTQGWTEQVHFIGGVHTLSKETSSWGWNTRQWVLREELERKIISSQGIGEGFKGKMAFKFWRICWILMAMWNRSDRGYQG